MLAFEHGNFLTNEAPNLAARLPLRSPSANGSSWGIKRQRYVVRRGRFTIEGTVAFATQLSRSPFSR